MQGLQAFDLSLMLLMPVWSSPITAQKCNGTGFSCSFDCKQILTCVNGIVFTASCPAGSFCDSVVGDCIATSCNNTCTTNGFQCTGAGTFPDPYSCSNFITCPSVGGTPTNTSCPPNYMFDPCTSSCSSSFTCTVPRIKCNSIFDMGVIPGNAEMYYKCNLGTSCAPVIEKCDDGAIYISEKSGCSPIGYDLCKEQPYTCIKEGFYPEPRNCTVYYYCDPNHSLTTHVCSPGEHYVQSAEGCLAGTC